MITPAFELSQDAESLTIAIRVPYSRASEFEVYYEGVDFKFYAKPYFLRLTLPGRISENAAEDGSYDMDKGIFTLRLSKETPGQHFEGLNMLTALLAPRKSRTAKSLVEVLGSSENSAELNDYEEEDFDWEIEQSPYEELTENDLNSQCFYGFGNLRTGVFKRLQDEMSDVVDIRDPDSTPPAERRRQRLAAEELKFDPDHYLADYFEDVTIRQILKYRPWWTIAFSKMMDSLGKSPEQINEEAFQVTFSDEEKYQLLKFTNKSYLLDKRAQHYVYYGLIDILLAYCYEIRATEGENNVESPWNIRKLSGTLCWFESWNNVHEILVSFGRRVLCYPLYRHFKLVTRAHIDTVKILHLGKSAILKCLLNIHKIFQENDPAYILNDLYISDYCIWIQKAKSKKLFSLAETLQRTYLVKGQLGLEIEELESAALLVQGEEKMLDVLWSASRLPLPGLDSLTIGSSVSDRISSSKTEDLNGAQAKPSECKVEKMSHVEENTPPMTNSFDFCTKPDIRTLDRSQGEQVHSSQSPGAPAPLIIELEEKMETTSAFSTAGNFSSG
ncbi:LOW QUALITY PROTEIN: protein SHQ1 homolog [Gracilinanus agilis]|uniref:LOW QUALITY PROTEIN: protein SHQ1 homolog n=1 Tax=Gracilinanus agilis TaxID=191870 RepID=UPI001CFDA428|nr:LOW QUALITY PROTEIN: protein SHQ1 homolog [Gracilinanus agilis]